MRITAATKRRYLRRKRVSLTLDIAATDSAKNRRTNRRKITLLRK